MVTSGPFVIARHSVSKRGVERELTTRPLSRPEMGIPLCFPVHLVDRGQRVAVQSPMLAKSPGPPGPSSDNPLNDQRASPLANSPRTELEQAMPSSGYVPTQFYLIDGPRATGWVQPAEPVRPVC